MMIMWTFHVAINLFLYSSWHYSVPHKRLNIQDGKTSRDNSKGTGLMFDSNAFISTIYSIVNDGGKKNRCCTSSF